MRSNQSSGLSTGQFAILAVLGVVALCSLLEAGFVFINKQFNPPVPTGLPTTVPIPTQAPSLAAATRDLSVTLPPTTTPAGPGTPASARTETRVPLASETLALPTQEPSSTPQATATTTATLPPSTATRPGPTRTARPRGSNTPSGPATAGPTQTSCFDC